MRRNGLKMTDLFELKRQFLEHCELEKGQSLLTINNYDRYLTRFFEFVESQQTKQTTENRRRKIATSDITGEQVRKYRLYVNRLKDAHGQELKKSTENYHMLALRAFLRYLAWRGIACLAPEKVPVAKAGDRSITFLEGDEIKLIINEPDTSKLSGLRDKAILELLFSTGLRVSELAALNSDGINFERGEISVMGKGKKIRVVFLSQEALFTIDQYLKNRGYMRPEPGSMGKHKEEPLFLSNREERLTVRSIERIVKKYALKAGMTKKVSPHTLRHSFATDLLIAGADIRSVQSMLGHSSITTTQVYTHVTDQHLREIHQKFHGKSLKEDEESLPKPE
jgi:site-specific recombinase XerD